MRRHQLEHAIRASTEIVQQDSVIVIGSQAVLGSWDEGRLNANTNGRTGSCLEPHDLCAAKLLAGRAKDREFVSALLDAGLVDADVLAERLGRTVTEPERSERARAWLAAVALRRGWPT